MKTKKDIEDVLNMTYLAEDMLKRHLGNVQMYVDINAGIDCDKRALVLESAIVDIDKQTAEAKERESFTISLEPMGIDEDYVMTCSIWLCKCNNENKTKQKELLKELLEEFPRLNVFMDDESCNWNPEGDMVGDDEYGYKFGTLKHVFNA